MVVRALVALMTLVGAMPFRVCTCGAAHHHHAPTPDAPLPPQFPVVSPDDPDPHHHHHPDCPAVKPRCAMSVGVTAGLVEVPDADHTRTAVGEPPQPAASERHDEPTSRPPPRGRPLYLMLQVFRN
jgi:hypothetical protein